MKKSRNLLWGISILPALLIMPAVAVNVDNFADFTAALENGGNVTLSGDLILGAASNVVADTVVDGGGHVLSGTVFNATQQGEATSSYVWDYTKTDETSGTIYGASSSMNVGTVVYSDADRTQEFGTVTMKIGPSSAYQYSVDSGTEKAVTYSAEDSSGKYLAFKDENDNLIYAYVNKTEPTIEDITVSTKFYSTMSTAAANQVAIDGFAVDGEGNCTVKEHETFTIQATEKPHVTYLAGDNEYYIAPSSATSTVLVKTLHDTKTLSSAAAGMYDGNVVALPGNFVIEDNVDFTLKNMSAIDNPFSISGGALISTRNTTATEKLGNIVIDNVNVDGSATTNKLGGVASLYNHNVNIKDSSFKNAVMNVTVSGGATVGGVLYANNSDVIVDEGVKFQNNKAGNGGGIYMENGSTLTLHQDTLFKNNAAVYPNGGKGGAIYVKDSKSSFALNGATFEGNSATGSGGAIFLDAYNPEQTIGITAKFYNNTAQQAGAVYLPTSNRAVLISDAVFTNNKATGSTSALGGAVLVNGQYSVKANTGTGPNDNPITSEMLAENLKTVQINGTSFSGNEAFYIDDDGMYWGTGGAIGQSMVTRYKYFSNGPLWSYGEILGINNSQFTNNIAGAEGGALNSDSKLNISNSSFVNNRTLGTAIGTNLNDSNEGGGAIFMYDDSIATIIDSTFESNKSGTWGGAISTRGISSAQPGADSSLAVSGGTFNTNSAVYGGAIANSLKNTVAEEVVTKYGATITDTTFTGNTATTNGGAIYNNGDIVFAGTNTFTGNTANGVANDIYNLGVVNVLSGTTTMDGGIDGTGALTIADGATLNMGVASIVQNTVNLNGTLNATLLNANKYAYFDVETFNVSENGSLNLSLKGVGEYEVFRDDIIDADVLFDSNLYDIAWNDAGDTITVSLRPVDDIIADTGLDKEAGAVITSVAMAASSSDSAQMQDMSLRLQDALASGDTASVEHAAKAIHPETESVVQSVSSSVQSTVTSLASGRMSMPTVGRNGGDVKMTSGGVWAQGIFNKSKQNDAFNGYTRGIAAGMDGTINKNWTIGAGYAFAHSDVTATARDTEIDSSSVFLYGQYKPSAWYVNAIANYTMSDYSEKGIALGTGVTADYDVNAYGANIATGYDFAGGVTPELALRYMHVDASDYTNSLDVKNKLESSDYLTASLGTKYAFDIKATKRLTVRPELRYAVKYDIVSDKQTATVTMPGVNSYVLDGERLSRIGGEFGIGMGVNYKGFDLSLNYDIEAREDYTSQSGRVKFRYNF